MAKVRVVEGFYATQIKKKNNLIRDLGFTKLNAELHLSKVKKWDLLEDNVWVTTQKKYYKHFSDFFTNQEGYIKQIMYLVCLMQWEFSLIHMRGGFSLTADLKSLKAVLLHNGNTHPSIT